MTTRVKSGTRRLLRAGLVTLLAVLLLGIVAPFINAGRFSGRIQRALELSLGRRVHFADVHFTLFHGPGFSLDDVIIEEDPRYGLEPFAHVTTLEARLRLDKLLLGHLSFASLKLVDPSLNLVKRSDGTWNVVELVERLSAPRQAPLNLFPAMEVSGARIDFKFGTRKTTLYIADADLTLYPERSGRLSIQFSGSPARTDRAGNGFGHLRGTADWHFNRAAGNSNRFRADLILDASNLSEMATLFEGHDIGIHGTVSSRARIEGPLTALRVSGELHLEDVHRWDLLPSSGEDWRIGYKGSLDLVAHQLNLETSPLHSGYAAPVTLQMRVADFLVHPEWTVLAEFDKVPVQDLLPLSRRMGLGLPQDLAMRGTLDGVIGYSNNGGLSGGVAINHLSATLPNLSPLGAPLVKATIFADRIHCELATIQASAAGALQVSGDYYLSNRRTVVLLSAAQFPVHELKTTIDAWFGSPSAIAFFRNGDMTGNLVYEHQGTEPERWSGQFQFSGSELAPPGLAVPLERSEGRISFDDSTLDLSGFSGTLGQQIVYGSYRYNALAKRPERIRLELPVADLGQIEAALDPTLRAQGLLARLRFTRRTIPPWLAARNLEGDLSIQQFSVNQNSLGPLSAHFTWQGANIHFSALQLNLPEGRIHAHGSVNLASYSPRYRFAAKANGFPWRGGFLNANGEFETFGTGLETLQHLHAGGTFSGEDLNLSADDVFSKASGLFDFSFADGWPNLRLSNIQASDGEDAWNGEAASRSDGKLVLDLEHDGRQRRVVSTLAPETPPVSSTMQPVPASAAVSSMASNYFHRPNSFSLLAINATR